MKEDSGFEEDQVQQEDQVGMLDQWVEKGVTSRLASSQSLLNSMRQNSCAAGSCGNEEWTAHTDGGDGCLKVFCRSCRGDRRGTRR